jgi:hypothetical protein
MLAKITAALARLDPAKLTPATLPGWLDIAVKVERLSRGQATTVGQRIADPDELELRARLDARMVQLIADVIRGVLTEVGIFDRPEVPGIVRRHLELVAAREDAGDDDSAGKLAPPERP